MRRSSFSAWCLVSAVFVAATGCGNDDVAATTADVAQTDVNPPDDGTFVRQAHRAALERFMEAGTAALVLADPVTAATLGHGSLAAPPLSRGSRATVRNAVDAALVESEGINRRSLTPQDAMVRDLMSVGLQAVRRDVDARPALRRDPTIFGARATALVDVVHTRLRQGSACEHCVTALTELGDELTRSPGQLGATSSASLNAAREDLAALDRRLAATEALSKEHAPKADHAAWADAIASAREGTAATTARLDAVATHLPDAAPATWQATVAGGATPEAVQRLPDRLGQTELDRRLTEEESVSFTGATLATEISLLLTRLARMRDRLPPPPKSPSPKAAVTVERCQAVWEPLAAWAKDNPVLAGAAFDCAAGAGLPTLPATATDAELVLRLFDAGIVLPSRAARRRDVSAALGLPSAVMASAGNQLALSVSGLISAERPAAARLAIARARRQLCVALAGMLEHGELGEPSDRADRLTESCPQHARADLVLEALARPRPALAAAGMVLISRGPAEAAALSLFWWAPLGLVGPLADPNRVVQPDPSTLPQPNVEVIQPRAGSGGPSGAATP